MTYILRILALLLCVCPLQAQNTVTKISLAEALRTARVNNPAYRAALADVKLARAEEKQGWGAFLPDARVSFATGGYLSRTFTGRNEFGQPVRRDDPLEFTRSHSSQGVSVGWTLFDGGARYRELRAAQALSRATLARARDEAARLEAEVTRRYYDALRTQRLILLEEQLLAPARERLLATERLLRVAARSPIDVLGAEAGVAEQELALEQAHGEARKAMLSLREEIGLLDGPAFELADDLTVVFDPVVLRLDTLMHMALRSNPRVVEREAAVSAAMLRTRAARARRWPTVSASAGVGRSISGEGYNALFALAPPDQGIDFGVVVSYPLLDRLQTSHSIVQAAAALTRAEEALRAQRLALEREVQGARIDLENAYRATQAAERSTILHRKRVQLAQEQYRFGVIPLTELQDMVDRAARAERDVVNAQYEFSRALATLEEKISARVRP